MDLSLFDYDLPPELIAQHPAERRDRSRLLSINRADGSLTDLHFNQLPTLLREGDLLVMNDTHVFPARLLGEKQPGGARIEMLLLRPFNEQEWEVIAYRASRLRAGVRVEFSDELACEVRETLKDGRFRVAFEWRGDWNDALIRHGGIPLPPYIERPDGADGGDRDRYQTVYARTRFELDSPAAPTAGLHFTPEVFAALREKGVEMAALTLRVGLDTFLPMRVETIEEHRMHSEDYDVPEETAQAVGRALCEGRRVIAVGTTSARTLESAALSENAIKPGPGSTDIYIYPGYNFTIVKAMITNFHLPRSTLLLMISAFMGNELRERAYAHAVANRFRFFSYGDSMFIQ
ncbi:MAG: tRNA preQ1(34) S-adenosylmethionine ribosyltransferase-isomerase QueA [bacterium]|nr:tRNA preQ1(34) S-adenosylmethionine ribosyltransferase-isomerase QueA [bacterium]